MVIVWEYTRILSITLLFYRIGIIIVTTIFSANNVQDVSRKVSMFRTLVLSAVTLYALLVIISVYSLKSTSSTFRGT